ncbi:hypothetical protein J437_LFUL003320 [Ladona fulva]|uniref:Ig-like domain-containing protein n=1 Tax=Ladona fulva TaxID=123851 RepID=A0A8K0P903_LADFU|nr:hypothetical protein J437_LFUL003320 [Ladona fulva]
MHRKKRGSDLSENSAKMVGVGKKRPFLGKEYLLDARERDRDFTQAVRWSDDNVFANRAYFMPEKLPYAELGIDHIRPSDAGVYRCRVDFRVAQTRNSKINLTVIAHFTQSPKKLWLLCEGKNSLLANVPTPILNALVGQEYPTGFNFEMPPHILTNSTIIVLKLKSVGDES